MIQVRLFGRFSDFLEDAEVLLVKPEGIASIEDIYRHFAAEKPALHREISGPQVLVAVNQEVVSMDFPVGDGDEVAFLPPVTGG